MDIKVLRDGRGIGILLDAAHLLAEKEQKELAKKGQQCSTSGRSVTKAVKPLDQRVEKRKRDDERPSTPDLREKRLKVATPENQVAGRQIQQLSGSGQVPELVHQHMFHVHDIYQWCQQTQQYQNIEALKYTISQQNNTGEKPHKCGQCDFASEYSSSLIQHMRIHTGEKSFVCRICDYACNQRCNLKTHMRAHTGEKPYKCIFCDYVAKTVGNVKSHSNNNHPDRKHIYPTYCENPFPFPPYKITTSPDIDPEITIKMVNA
ncbi:C2H2-type zinc finger protein [Endozoicomonas sp.]|uniref:C2H2-type zinc finger protein n=1 Tax=Endozoicomonas sp. TaxID=1892382 RepID=UPI002884F7F1|nr:hypothetical protein [Endozoicomonas sp.]